MINDPSFCSMFTFHHMFAPTSNAGAKKDYGGMNPALCELAGHLLMTGQREKSILFFFSK